MLGEKTKKGMRFTRNIGLGFKTPKEAIEGSYVDKKCPFTGGVSIRGRILKGLVIGSKMKNTLIIRRDYLRWVGSTAGASGEPRAASRERRPTLPFAASRAARVSRAGARGARMRARSQAASLTRARSRLSARRSFEKRHKNLAAHVSPCFINEGGRYRHRRAVPAAVEDGALQRYRARAVGEPGAQRQERAGCA